MGNYVEMHSDKRRGLDIDDVRLEARIHWNGPPIHHATRLGESALVDTLEEDVGGILLPKITNWNHP